MSLSRGQRHDFRLFSRDCATEFANDLWHGKRRDLLHIFSPIPKLSNFFMNLRHGLRHGLFHSFSSSFFFEGLA